jgi:hypothetical protein
MLRFRLSRFAFFETPIHPALPLFHVRRSARFRRHAVPVRFLMDTDVIPLRVLRDEVEGHEHIEPPRHRVGLLHGASEAQRHPREALDIVGPPRFVHEIDYRRFPEFAFLIGNLQVRQFAKLVKIRKVHAARHRRLPSALLPRVPRPAAAPRTDVRLHPKGHAATIELIQEFGKVLHAPGEPVQFRNDDRIHRAGIHQGQKPRRAAFFRVVYGIRKVFVQLFQRVPDEDGSSGFRRRPVLGKAG